MQIPLITPALAWLAFVRRHALTGTVSGVGPLVEGDATGPFWWVLAATGEHGWEETAPEAWDQVDARKGGASRATGHPSAARQPSTGRTASRDRQRFSGDSGEAGRRSRT